MPVALELVASSDSITTIPKDKIVKVTTTAEAWKLLDIEYGNLQEVCAKLKEQVRCIKLKATSDQRQLNISTKSKLQLQK